MTRWVLRVLLLGACAAPAAAWQMFGQPSDGKIRPVQHLHDDGKIRETLAALSPEFIATLRGTDLRQAYILMGDNLRKLGKLDEALGQYQLGVSLFPTNVDLLVRQAMVLHESGLDERARPLFMRALAIEPRHWNAHQGLAEIDRDSGFLDRAASHYEIALESLEKRANVWRDYAEVLLRLREYKTAGLALHKSLELEPGSSDAHILLAFARRAQNDVDGAQEELGEAEKLGAGVGAQRAKALFFLEAGRRREAQAAAETILKSVPNDGAALWVRARLRLAQGDAAGALRDLTAMNMDNEHLSFTIAAARKLSDEIKKMNLRREDASLKQ